MKYAAVLLALGASVVSAQGSCSPSLDTNAFTFQTMNVTVSGKRSWEEVHMEKRQSISCGDSVKLHLSGGLLNDDQGRQGYVASNDQFQFDGPPQAKHKQTDGFEVCTLSTQNQRLALDGNTIFYNCLSGTFNNIYTKSQGAQCYEVYVQVYPCVAKSILPTAPTASFSGNTGAPATMSFSESMAASSASASMMVMTAQPMTSTPSALMTPYPVSNSTSVAATGSAVVTPSTSSPGAISPAPSSFTGAANVLAVGQKLVGLAAGAVAVAMF